MIIQFKVAHYHKFSIFHLAGLCFSSYMITNDMNVATVISPITENVIIVKDFVGAAYLIDWEFNGIGDFLVGQGLSK